jgi:hypothetical protein
MLADCKRTKNKQLMLDVFVRIHVNHCFGFNWNSKSRC